jgi:ribosome-associated toxin RatA of RatAB toxin-antitoxin module
MATLCNDILINGSIDKIWAALTDLDLLEKYDPTVKRSRLVSGKNANIGAAHRVDMQDGKNWFEEKVTVVNTNESLAFELTACSFPVHKLKHSYTFELLDSRIRVKQVMEYEVKYGMVGKVLDSLVVKKQSDTGIKKFLQGLKLYVENS